MLSLLDKKIFRPYIGPTFAPGVESLWWRGGPMQILVRRTSAVSFSSSAKQAMLLFAVFLLAFAAFPVSLYSQSSTTGLVTGVVTDPSRATVPGATVTLERKDTNASQTAVTASSRRYIFPARHPGRYTV